MLANQASKPDGCKKFFKSIAIKDVTFCSLWYETWRKIWNKRGTAQLVIPLKVQQSQRLSKLPNVCFWKVLAERIKKPGTTGSLSKWYQIVKILKTKTWNKDLPQGIEEANKDLFNFSMNFLKKNLFKNKPNIAKIYNNRSRYDRIPFQVVWVISEKN